MDLKALRYRVANCGHLHMDGGENGDLRSELNNSIGPLEIVRFLFQI
jgi:hypothetical protein